MIRLGTMEDFTTLWELMRKHGAEMNESSNEFFGWDDGDAMDSLTKWLQQDVVFIYSQKDAEGHQEDLGVLVVGWGKAFFSKKKFFKGEWFYVRNDARHTRAAFKLLKAATDFALLNGTNFSMSINNFERVSAKNRLLERFGFKAIGGYFVLRGEEAAYA